MYNKTNATHNDDDDDDDNNDSAAIHISLL